MSLVKITGRDLVTTQEQRTRQVWVDNPVSPPVEPPTTPLIQSPPVTPNVYVPFVGPALIPCTNTEGQSGMMLAIRNADGTVTPLTVCLVNNGLS